jgi:hypothetical protein
MAREIRFRTLLPVAQFMLAALLGGVGLWQRSSILNRPLFEGQTLWDSTARYHVWPWQFKLAVIANMSAFLAGTLVVWPVASRLQGLPEFVWCVPSLLFVPILWYGIGRWLDRRWGHMNKAATQMTQSWVELLSFTIVCAVGAFIPSTSGYLPYGVAVWIIVGSWLRPR